MHTICSFSWITTINVPGRLCVILFEGIPHLPTQSKEQISKHAIWTQRYSKPVSHMKLFCSYFRIISEVKKRVGRIILRHTLFNSMCAAKPSSKITHSKTRYIRGTTSENIHCISISYLTRVIARLHRKQALITSRFPPPGSFERLGVNT